MCSNNTETNKITNKPRSRRRRNALQQELVREGMPEEQQRAIMSELEKRESDYMRLQRQRMGADDFEPLTIIGRGAFGEVRREPAGAVARAEGACGRGGGRRRGLRARARAAGRGGPPGSGRSEPGARVCACPLLEKKTTLRARHCFPGPPPPPATPPPLPTPNTHARPAGALRAQGHN